MRARFWRRVQAWAELAEYRLGGLVEYAAERTGEPHNVEWLYQYNPDGESTTYTASGVFTVTGEEPTT